MCLCLGCRDDTAGRIVAKMRVWGVFAVSVCMRVCVCGLVPSLCQCVVPPSALSFLLEVLSPQGALYMAFLEDQTYLCSLNSAADSLLRFMVKS